MLYQPKQSVKVNRRDRWVERGIALLAALNLALVFFDITYLNVRSIYLQFIPSLVQSYDFVKGIRPHPETQRYLAQVAALESQLTQMDVRSPEVEASLSELRSDSQQLIQDNPFSENSQAILETIQQNLQLRTSAESSFVAFDRFWSQDYLAEAGWQSEIEYWNQQIRPLINANYYHRVNRFGDSIDYFWLIDLPFILLFAIEFVIQNQAIRRRNPQLSRLEAALRRWYDLLLLIPIWRWLRIIPVTLRLHQTGLLNLKPLEAEVRRDFAIGFAKDLTEIVGVRAINQMQAAIRRGDVMRWLLYPELRRNYVQVNDRNEVSAIATRVTNLTIHQVLPQIQPEVERFIYKVLHHLLFESLPGYRQFGFIPGMGSLRGQTTDRAATTLSKSAYKSLEQFLKDPEVAQLTAQLIQSFWNALSIELQEQQNTQEIEDLLIDMLEEIKINYVQAITEVEIEQIIDEAEQLHREAES